MTDWLMIKKNAKDYCGWVYLLWLSIPVFLNHEFKPGNPIRNASINQSINRVTSLNFFLGIASPAVVRETQKKPPDSFTLIWEAESFSPIFEYKILFRKENNLPWISFIIPADSLSSVPLHTKSYTLNGLDRLSLYEVKIFSRNRFGWSFPSEVIKFGFTNFHLSEGKK